VVMSWRMPKKSRDVAGDQVDFQVHPLPWLQRAQIGACQGVGYNIYHEAVLRHLVNGQAHPVKCHRALWRDKGSKFLRRLEDKANRLCLGLPLGDPRDTVDMTQDEMPAKLVAKPERFFEIDRSTLFPFPEGGAGQRFDRHLHRKGSGLHRNDGEARPGASDRGADRDRYGVESRGDSQLQKLAAQQPPHPSDIGDDSSKHAGKLWVCPTIYQGLLIPDWMPGSAS
jgi:hypothetical protein